MGRNSRRATQAGINEAKKALKRKVWTNQRLATEVGCGSNTISNFFNGTKIDNKFFKGICTALDLEEKKIVDLSEDAEPKLEDEQQARSLFAHPFQTIIDQKTKNFVGREYVFTEIAKFINSKTSGYFTIIGDPGIGKSTILAKYVQDTGCVAHFNVENDGENRADQFLESVCKQLIKQYQLSYSLALPADAKSDGVFLRKLLDEVAIKRNGKPVVIAVDALDEVDQSSQTNKNANILYFPRYLPSGIYFVTTVRRGVDIPLVTDAPQQIFNFVNYQSQSRADV